MSKYRWCLNCEWDQIFKNSKDNWICICRNTDSENYLQSVCITDSCPLFEGDDPDEVYEDG